jgi:splicing factor 3B subunit 4
LATREWASRARVFRLPLLLTSTTLSFLPLSPQRNQDATLHVGNLDERVDEDLLWELFVQAGPLADVHLPTDKVSGKHSGYGFVEFRSEDDCDYALKIMNMVRLYGKSVRISKASSDKTRTAEVGANLFIGNLAPEVDEKSLFDTFSAFGTIVSAPRVMRDLDTGASKGFGFVNFDSFEASDSAIEALNGKFFGGRPVVAQYAYKKGTTGERHGSQAERVLAAAARSKTALRPHTLFALAPGQVQSSVPQSGMVGGAGASSSSSSSGPAPPFMLTATATLPAALQPAQQHSLPSTAPSGGPGGAGPGAGGLPPNLPFMPPPLPMMSMPPRMPFAPPPLPFGGAYPPPQGYPPPPGMYPPQHGGVMPPRHVTPHWMGAGGGGGPPPLPPMMMQPPPLPHHPHNHPYPMQQR